MSLCPQQPYFQVWIGVAALLVFATLAGWLFDRLRPSPETHNNMLRIRTWWIISAVLFLAMQAGIAGVAVLIFILGVLAAREILSPARHTPGSWFIVFVPISLFVLSGLVHIGLLSWRESGCCGGYHCVFFLLLLTSLNDVAQYLWGKSIGGPRITPRISPQKTWAGFLGGAMTTGLIAAWLAPWLTPLPRATAGAAGLIIGVGGFSGDIAVSAWKRLTGRESSGSLLPGHGGILDRIDSLCLTAPLFYWFTRLIHYC